MKLLHKLLFTTALFSSVVAFSATDSNKTIAGVGSQGNMAYVSFTSTLSTTCPYNLLYIADLNSAAGKAAYATLLTAYTSGGVISRVDYYPNAAANNRCDIYIVQL